MINVLFVYFNNQYPLRQTILNGLRAFDAVDGVRVFRYNAALFSLPLYFRLVKFDLVVFSTIFLSQHWGGRQHFHKVMRKVGALKNTDACTVALPQDEFFYPDLYVEFFNEFRVRHIYSVSQPDTWSKLYRGLTYTPVFHRALTGYLSTDEIARHAQLAAERDIVIGYRTIGTPTPIYGRHGRLKWEIADEFRQACSARGYKYDISTRDEDKLLGEAWYDFLKRCKYVIGVEGGTSIVDHDGSLTKKVNDYCLQHPEAGFNDVASALLSDAEGNINIRAISPRHLECCMTKTAQILIEGDYSGVLRPGKHYLAVKSDFSNLNEVMELLEDECNRITMVEAAYKDIVASGRYTYTHFAKELVRDCLYARDRDETQHSSEQKFRVALVATLNRMGGVCEVCYIRGVYVPVVAPLKRLVRNILARFPVLKKQTLKIRRKLRGY